jgi:hypothetical protein
MIQKQSKTPLTNRLMMAPVDLTTYEKSSFASIVHPISTKPNDSQGIPTSYKHGESHQPEVDIKRLFIGQFANKKAHGGSG